MEGTPSSRSTDEAAGEWLSCWGRFLLKLPWTKRRIWRDTSRRKGNLRCNIAAAFGSKHPKLAGGFKYDALSYAQNFDEGSWDKVDEDSLSRGFSSRYAAPSKSLGV